MTAISFHWRTLCHRFYPFLVTSSCSHLCVCVAIIPFNFCFCLAIWRSLLPGSHPCGRLSPMENTFILPILETPSIKKRLLIKTLTIINDYISLSLLNNNIINIIILDDVERLAYKSLWKTRYYGNKRAAKQIHSHYSNSVICFTARASVTETLYTTIRINQEFNSWLSTLRCSAGSLGVFSPQLPANK